MVCGSLCGSVFSIVVVAENALYTTTTSRLCGRLLFGVCVGSRLQTGCSVLRKQNSKCEPEKLKGLLFKSFVIF